MRRASLEDAMPVQAGGFVAQLVEDIDDEPVAFGDSQGWDRPLTVDAHDGAIEEAIGISSHPRDVEVVRDGGSAHDGQDGQRAEQGDNSRHFSDQMLKKWTVDNGETNNCVESRTKGKNGRSQRRGSRCLQTDLQDAK